MPQAPTVELPKRLPLIIGPENRGDTTSYDAKLVNAYMETRQGAEGPEHWIYERPGQLLSSRPPAGNAIGRGIWNWLGDIYSIFGNTLYKNDIAVSGTVDTTNGVYRFDSCLGATPKLQLGNGVKAYNYDAGAGLVLINDPDFPSSFVKGWSYLNGTTYIMTPTAHILGDDVNDPTNWDPLNDILAQIEPDQGVALAKQLVYTIALKQWTTEVFYDAGNASGSPLGRVEGAKVNWGCIHADTVQEIDGMLIWLAQTKDGSPDVVLLNQLKAESVATKPIQRLLENSNLSSFYSWTLKHDGHRFYILTLVSANLTLVYDLNERMWSQWTDKDGNYVPIAASCTTLTNSMHQHLVQHATNGKIYLMDSSYATDDGDTITVDIYTPNFDGGVRRKKHMKLLRMITDQQVGSILQCRVNDYDYAPDKWTNYRQFDLSKKNPTLPDCGSFYRRVHHFRHARPVRMPRIQAMEMQLDLGTL